MWHLEVNSALVIWHEGTGCAQYHNSNIQKRSQNDMPLSLEPTLTGDHIYCFLLQGAMSWQT